MFGSILNAIKKVGSMGLGLLKKFNPFTDNEYRNASSNDRLQFESKVQEIANNAQLDHEFRMEAKRVLVKIESFRHAEELARIEGTTKITIAHIEASRDVVLAKVDLLKSNIEGCRNKEIALITAIGTSPQLADSFLSRLDATTQEIKEIEGNLTTYSQELTYLGNISRSKINNGMLQIGDSNIKEKSINEAKSETSRKRTRTRTRKKLTN